MRWIGGLLGLVVVGLGSGLRAEDGYLLWLRYSRLAPSELAASGPAAVREVILRTSAGADSIQIAAARNELNRGLTGLLGRRVKLRLEKLSAAEAGDASAWGHDGYRLHDAGGGVIEIVAPSDMGAVYGSFALLRKLAVGEPLVALDESSTPKIQRRLLNHWDNLNGFVERGYAGDSLWEWFTLPEYRSPRYTDYARALASVGLNGTVLNNVNANALILTPDYLKKVAVLAGVFRPYGVRVYLTARFSAPMEIGGLATADPLDPAVRAWWDAKVEEIYTLIPDFGGFLVKANSEGQPGPHDYGRTHADGANMLAEPLARHDGIVMWRAFVYSHNDDTDRVKQAYEHFVPLDGKFADNVVLQIKNGPLDFMPREPVSPLFGAMPQTRLALELQITQEYLGASTQLCYLGPLFTEVLDANTHLPAATAGLTVGEVIAAGKMADPKSAGGLSVIAGVANTGADRNWTGHPMAQSNWYAFGRLAWDHTLSADRIADEWVRQTFSSDSATRAVIRDILMGSRETVVNYSMPLGLHHIMASGHHYGPGPWVTGGRADWTAPYYHQADAEGLGANRIASGSNALEQYAPELQREWGDPTTIPEILLLWFHHVGWTTPLRSGRTLWDTLALRYQQGVDEVRTMRTKWDTLAGKIDDERWAHVQQLLARQETDAREWRDACLWYFQQFSKLPLPAGVDAPEFPLEHYTAVNRRFVPGHPGDQ